jgi:hypothetical protein
MPAGWTPKSTAPAAFDMGQAFGALISGQADSWLSAWLHLLGGELLSTANFCTNVSFDTPTLELSDFSSLVPTSTPTLIGAGLAFGMTALSLQTKIAQYAAARIGAAFCESGGVGLCHFLEFSGSLTATSPASWTPLAPVTIRPGCIGMSVNIHNVGTEAAAFHILDSIAPTTSVAPGARFIHTYGQDSGDTPGLPSIGTFKLEVALFGTTAVPFLIEVSQHATCTAGTDAVPTIAPDPPGLPPPATNVYVNIPDLGAELDVHEHKLDLIRDLLIYLTNTVAPPAITLAPTLPASGEIALQQAKGIVVSVSGIPPQTDETFGTPTKYHRLGRITFGTTAAWFAPIDISENPMIVAPIPPFATRVQISVQAPATASYMVVN